MAVAMPLSTLVMRPARAPCRLRGRRGREGATIGIRTGTMRKIFSRLYLGESAP
jgi:hypothetical protein